MRFYWLMMTSLHLEPPHVRFDWRCAQKHHHIWQCWAFDIKHWLRGKYPYDDKVIRLTWAQILYLAYLEAILLMFLILSLVMRGVLR